MTFAAGTTAVRYSPPSRALLLKLARAGSRLASKPGRLRSPNIQAICDALQVALAENDVLRREVTALKQRLARAQDWHDEPTRREEVTDPGILKVARHG
ncbi:MAG TPA: hypothetical protein VLN57_21335 [Xanthobacteraceae bacterium]|nr:hypothetical protein [Xanthobacteraceae bacterium]